MPSRKFQLHKNNEVLNWTKIERLIPVLRQMILLAKLIAKFRMKVFSSNFATSAAYESSRIKMDSLNQVV
jgi:hypothetical protein